MYGVLCISGDVTDLSEEQRNKAREGIDFYKKVSPIIISGTTKRFGPFQNSNRELKGYQVSVRYGENGGILVIAHSFKIEQPVNILIDIPDGYKVIDKYETADHSIMTGGCKLEFTFRDSFDAFALLLEI